MNPYLITILLVLPPQPGQPDVATVMPPRVIGNFSSPSACQAHANQLAAERREREAATVARLKARVVGECKPVEVPK